MSLGLQSFWEAGEVLLCRDAWKRLVKSIIRAHEEIDWRADMAGVGRTGRGRGAKSKLRIYMQCKRRLRMEKYVAEGKDVRRRMLKLRAGAADLHVETLRRKNIARHNRICPLCDTGQVEDEVHFLANCAALQKQRDAMWREIRRTARVYGTEVYIYTDKGHSEAIWLLRMYQSRETRLEIMRGIKNMHRERDRVLGVRGKV